MAPTALEHTSNIPDGGSGPNCPRIRSRAKLKGVTRITQVPFDARPLTPRTLAIFLVAHALSQSGDVNVAFLSGGWSACPAQRLIPEVMSGAWHAAKEKETRRTSLHTEMRAGRFPRYRVVSDNDRRSGA